MCAKIQNIFDSAKKRDLNLDISSFFYKFAS